jgi:acyl carrier protein
MESSTKVVTPEEIKGVIVELLVDELDVEPELITDSATMEELDLDSLDLVEIGQIMEQKYGVRIRPADAEGVTDIGGIVAMIHKKVASGGEDSPEDDENAK